MKTIRTAALSVVLLFAIAGCASTGRARGPVDTFVIPAALNPGLSADIVGELHFGTRQNDVVLVVPANTDVHALVARLSLNTEATISVISTGEKVVQQNGVTPNDFSVPVLYSVEVPGQKEAWRCRVTVRVEESNAQLAQLLFPAGSTLQPAFNPTVHQYDAALPYATTQVHIQAVAQSRYAKSVTVDGKTTAGAAAVADVDFSSIQSKQITIQTTAEDGVTRGSYTVTLSRAAPDSNSLLESLDLQGFPFPSGFSAAQSEYRLVVPYETQNLVIRARPQSGVAKVSLSSSALVNPGQPIAPMQAVSGDPSGKAGAVVEFPQGPGLSLLVEVTAQNGASRPYTVIVSRAAPDSNSLLSDLALDVGGGATALSPNFSPSGLRYMAIMPYATKQIRVTAHTQSATATLQLGGGEAGVAVQGVPSSPGGALVAVPPGMGRVSLLLMVTAQNGSATGYAIEIHRAEADRNSELAALTVGGSALTPPFSPRIRSYAVTLPPQTESAAFVAVASHRESVVSVTGQSAPAPAQNLNFAVKVPAGSTVTVDFTVRAEDGSLSHYVVLVTRPLAAETPSTAPPSAPAGPQTQPSPSPPPVQAPPAQTPPVQTPPAQTPPQVSPAPAQPAPAQPTASPTPLMGPDLITVAAKDLAVGQRELTALTAGKDSIGKSAKITIRPYRSSQTISEATTPVEIKRKGPTLTLSFQYRGTATLGGDGLVEVEVLIPTTAGKALYYRQALPAGTEIKLSIPFLLYGAATAAPWPALGSAVKVEGYASIAAEHREDAENFQKNAQGQYQLTLELSDAKSGRILGTATAWRKPGLARGQTIAVVPAITLSEGMQVRYTLTARTADGGAWTASGLAPVWTTQLRYEGGFEPVYLPLVDSLSAARK